MADDTRVVQMQFDNKNFEKNISTSQKSLDRFKSSLNFDAATKGLKNFAQQVNSITFNTLANNIQKLTDKFTGFGNAAEFVISRIRAKLEGLATQALNFMESITVGQMSAGFTKYESLNKAVQTLKAATGKEEKDIYGILERLNKYTDETSYDFAQGVTSISKLVSSGAASLSQAEKVVEGFYNFAAKAGADTTSASHALQYSINQAMGTGYLGLNDFKTLENLSMATIDFKTQLLEAAVAVGTVTKENDKYYIATKKGSKAKKQEVNATNLFRNSLSEQWATTKVMNIALSKYADTTTEFGAEAFAAAQRCTTFTDALNAWKDMMSTGWMTSYRTIFGDLGDAMSLFSAVCNKVSESLDGLMSSVNQILSGWKTVGGRDALWGMLFGEMEDPDGKKLFEGARGVLDIFQTVGGMVSEGFWDMTQNMISDSDKEKFLKLWNSRLDEINQAMREQGREDLVHEGPFTSFEELWNSDQFIGMNGRQGVFGAMLSEITEKVQNFVAGIHDWFNEVDENTGLTRIQKMQQILNAVINTISFGFDILSGIFGFFSEIATQLSPSFKAIMEGLRLLGIGLEQSEQDARNSGSITQFFTELAEIIRPFTEMVNDLTEAFVGMIVSIAGSAEVGEGAKSAFQSIADVIKKVFSTIANVMRPVVDFIKEAFNIVGDLFAGGLTEEGLTRAQERITEAFTKMWDGLKAAVQPIIDKVVALAKLVWKTIKTKIEAYFNDENSLGHKILEPLMPILGPVWETLKDIFNKIKGTLSGAGKDIQDGGKTLFQTIGDILSPLFEKLKTVNLWSVAKALVGGYAVYKVLKLISGAGRIVSSVADFVENPFRYLKESLFGSNEPSFLDNVWSLAKSIAIITGSLLLLGNMEWGQIARAMAGLGGTLLLLAGYMGLLKLMKVDGDQLKGFAKFALSMGILILSLKTFAGMNWEQYGKMMAGLGGVLLEMSGFMGLMKAMKIDLDLLKGFIKFALSMAILVLTLKSFAGMSWEQLGKVGAGLGGILLELIGFMGLLKLMKVDTDMLKGFITFALSMTILVLTLKSFAGMDWVDIGKVGAAFAGILGGLIGAIAILKAINIDQKIINSVSMLAGVIGGVLNMIKPLKDLSWEELGKVGAGFGGVLLGLVGALGLMKLFKVNTSDMGGFMAFVISVGALVRVLMPIAGYDWDDLGKMGASLGALIIEMVGFMWLMKKVTVEKKDLAKMLLAAASLALITYAFSKALERIKGMQWEAIAVFAGGISVAMIALAGAVFILSKIDLAKGLKGIVLLVAAIAAISLIADFVSAGIGNAVSNLTGPLAEAGTMIAFFSNKMGEVNEDNIAKAERVINKLKDVFASLYGMSSHMGDLDAFATGLWEISVSLNAFHSLTGHIQGPDNNGAIQLLSWFKDNADALSGLNFGDAAIAIATLGAGLWIFSDLQKDFPTVGEGEKLPAVQLIETIAGLKDTITDLNGVGTFGTQVGRLGSGLRNFIDSSGDITEGSDQAPGVKLLTALANNAAGIQTLMSLKLGGLGDQLTLLGGGISIYATAADELGKVGADGTEIPDISAAVEILNQVVAQLSGETGEVKLPTLPTEGESALFGTQMAGLAGGLKQFITASEGISDNTQKGLDAIGFLASIKTELTDDLIKFVNATGSTDGFDGTSLGAFGTDLGVLANGLSDFIAKSEGISDNTYKGLAAIGFLSDINGELTDDVVKVINYFPDKSITNTMLAQLGTDLVTLAKGLAAFAAVEVGDISPQLGLLDSMSELNEKLTNLQMDSMVRTVAGFLTPINTDKLSSEAYGEYLKSITELTENEKSPLAVFSFGITQLGAALQEFAAKITENGYFTREYEEPMENAKAAIEFFQEQFNKMPKISRGFMADILGYSQDLSDLNKPIILLGDSLANFGEKITTAYEAGKWNVEAINSAIGGISSLVTAFVDINTAMDNMFSMIHRYDRNDASAIGGYLSNLGKDATDLIDGGKAMRWLGKQLNFVIEAMTDTEYAGINGKSVLDNYMELCADIKDRMANMNLTQQDLDRVSSSLTTLTNLVSVFNPNNYPTDNNIQNYINLLMQDLHNAVYDNGKLVGYDVDQLANMLESIKESLNSLLSFGVDYISPGEDKIKQASNDFGLFVSGVMDSVSAYLKSNTDEDDVNALISTLSDWNDVAAIIKNVADAWSAINTIPDLNSALSGIGASVADMIALGIEGDTSSQRMQAAVKNLLGGIGNTIISDPSELLGTFSKTSLTDYVYRMMYGGDASAFNKAGASDLMANFSSALSKQTEGYTASFEDLGFFMGLMISNGISNSKPVLLNTVRTLFTETGNEVMSGLLGETLNMDKLLELFFQTKGKDLESVGVEDYIEALREASNPESWLQTSSFEDVGYFMAIGVAIGVSKGTYLIENACRVAVEAARAAAMAAADAHSPSLVFAQIGGWLSQGMANGITGAAGIVADAASGMTEDVIDKTASVMATVTSLMSQDVEANPTITPVLDMTNITAGAQAMNELLSGERDLSLTANGNRYARDAVPVTDRGTTDYRGQDLSWIQGAIETLGNRIDAMGSKISNMQIVMNTGALVGQVSEGVNRDIGSKTTYRRRRN